MRFAHIILFAIFTFTSFSSSAGIPLLAQKDDLPTLAPMLKNTMPGVVNISTRSKVKLRENPLFNDPFFRRFFDLPERQPRERESQSLGSGVIVDAKNGYIITNNHVIKGADEIEVKLRDGREMLAKLIGSDPEVDLAVIQIEADNLSQLSFADSDTLEVGDFVIAIGNPFGLGQTVTSGIVSAMGRSGLGIEGYEDFIQTDASINPGNSGGALVNLKGELVGINTAIVGPAGGNVGIGFAIPSNMTRDIMSQLIEYGEVKRGQLGVLIQDLTPDLARAFDLKVTKGAVVSQVIPGSPADKGGLKPGDVVTAVNGKSINSSSDLRNAVGLLRLGSKVELEIYRGKQKITTTIKLTERQTLASKGKDVGEMDGLTLGPIPSDHPLAGKTDGVLVLSLERSSRAWRSGVRDGDIIVSVNHQSVTNVEEVRKALKGSSNGVLLNIRRGDGALFLVVK